MAEWSCVAWINTGLVDPPKPNITNPSTIRDRCSLALLMWTTSLPLRQNSCISSKWCGRWPPKGSGKCTQSKILIYIRYFQLKISDIYHRYISCQPWPLSSMQLLELLTNFPNRTIVNTARNTFSRHLWYFSEMLVGLSFLDNRIGRCKNTDGGSVLRKV